MAEYVYETKNGALLSMPQWILGLQKGSGVSLIGEEFTDIHPEPLRDFRNGVDGR